ncbi:MAG: helix-turn-helix domain-containing protein, partial [Eubacteriales bacterium]|nr:helix-turn-helix domain-containing protein [Eubacteriales bacterium]
LVEEAHKLIPELEVIVISGYAQFDYAQTAIRFGVGEYLLKPINREALNRSLEKMAGRCHARRRQQTDIESLRERRDGDRQLLRAKLITDLLARRLAASDTEDVARTYHFAAKDDVLQLLLVKPDYDPSRFGKPSLSIVQEKMTGIFEPILAAQCSEAVLSFSDSCLVCVFNYPRERQETLRSQLRAVLNRLVAEKNLFGSIEFSAALGAPCATFAALAASVPEALNLLAERLIEGTGRLLEGQSIASGLLNMDYQARYTLAAAHAADVLDEAEADAAVAVLEEAVSVPGARGWELETLTRMAGQMFVNRLGSEDGAAALAEFDNRCSLCGSTTELFGCLRTLQREQIAQTRQRLNDRDAQPIRNAKLYIRKHFASPITLEEVSAAIGFSVNYFSTLFKKETGEGFAKYVTHVRMDEARALLRDTGYPVAKICQSVGYGDLKHFTRTFKAETGLTPSEYRKLYG